MAVDRLRLNVPRTIDLVIEWSISVGGRQMVQLQQPRPAVTAEWIRLVCPVHGAGGKRVPLGMVLRALVVRDDDIARIAIRSAAALPVNFGTCRTGHCVWFQVRWTSASWYARAEWSTPPRHANIDGRPEQQEEHDGEHAASHVATLAR